MENILVEPVLFSKNGIRVALYGIGHIKDERLNIALKEGKLKFKRPMEQDYFNILVLHQNRYKGVALGASMGCSIQENQIPDFIDLVIWGHEHESIP